LEVSSIVLVRSLHPSAAVAKAFGTAMAIRGEILLILAFVAVTLPHATANLAPPPFEPLKCLCTFDIDRTLTGSQKRGVAPPCSHNKVIAGINDTAYPDKEGSRCLSLSEVGISLDGTPCEKCYVGVVSAGGADVDKFGPNNAMRKELVKRLNGPGRLLSTQWSGPQATKKQYGKNCTEEDAQSQMVVGCNDGTKQWAVAGILTWLHKEHGVDILPGDVWHFDDRSNNIEPFRGSGFNARQISCETRDDASWTPPSHRDGAIGLCGATKAEIRKEPGVVLCKKRVDIIV